MEAARILLPISRIGARFSGGSSSTVMKAMVTRSTPWVDDAGTTAMTPGIFMYFSDSALATFSVAASEEPSGISTNTPSSLWSSCGIQSRPMVR